MRCIAASALAAGMLTLPAGNALANNHGTVAPERNQKVAADHLALTAETPSEARCSDPGSVEILQIAAVAWGSEIVT
ncbi:hypothetical protein [Streptomyces sp. NPDC003032]